MMKNIAIIVLAVLLVLSLGGTWFALKDVVLAKPKYSVPNWSTEEKEILNKTYSELGRLEKVPLSSYPYKIEKTEEGYTIKFQTFEFLRLRESVLLGEEIYDGCAFYDFDERLKFIKVSYCG